MGFWEKKRKWKWRYGFWARAIWRWKIGKNLEKFGGPKKNFGPLPHKNDCNFAPVCAIFLIFCVWVSNNQLPFIAFIVHVLHCQYTPSRNKANIFKMPPGGPRVKKKSNFSKILYFYPKLLKIAFGIIVSSSDNYGCEWVSWGMWGWKVFIPS